MVLGGWTALSADSSSHATEALSFIVDSRIVATFPFIVNLVDPRPMLALMVNSSFSPRPIEKVPPVSLEN